MPEPTPALTPPFSSPVQQREAATLGMWVFLASEVMLFGALIVGLCVYRTCHLEAFTAASHQLELGLGTADTALLLTSSLFVALAVRAGQLARRRAIVGWLLAAMALGVAFLGLKGLEYYHHYQHHLAPALGFQWSGPDPGSAQLFFWLYFFVTGLHALHLTLGVGVLGWMAVAAALGRFTRTYHTPLTLAGLYWHLVDVVWVFLYPLFYLVGHHA